MPNKSLSKLYRLVWVVIPELLLRGRSQLCDRLPAEGMSQPKPSATCAKAIPSCGTAAAARDLGDRRARCLGAPGSAWRCHKLPLDDRSRPLMPQEVFRCPRVPASAICQFAAQPPFTKRGKMWLIGSCEQRHRRRPPARTDHWQLLCEMTGARPLLAALESPGGIQPHRRHLGGRNQTCEISEISEIRGGLFALISLFSQLVR
jgi:hypothetical protein